MLSNSGTKCHDYRHHKQPEPLTCCGCSQLWDTGTRELRSFMPDQLLGLHSSAVSAVLLGYPAPLHPRVSSLHQCCALPRPGGTDPAPVRKDHAELGTNLPRSSIGMVMFTKPLHPATVKPFVDFRLCNIRFLATLFAFSKNKMSLPVASYFEQNQGCCRSTPGRTLGEHGFTHHLALDGTGWRLCRLCCFTHKQGSHRNPASDLSSTCCGPKHRDLQTRSHVF